MARKKNRRSSADKPSRQPGDPLPSRDDILKFINNAQGEVGKREISRAFGIKGPDRGPFKTLLTEMASEGLLAGNRKGLRQPGRLPSVTVLQISGQDDDGDLIATPSVWDSEEGPRPEVLIVDKPSPFTPSPSTLGIGDKILARITVVDDQDESAGDDTGQYPSDYAFTAYVIKKLAAEKQSLLGIFRANRKSGGTIEPVDRKSLRSWSIQPGDEAGADDGDLVYFDLAKRGRFKTPQARITKSLGNPDDQRQISLIAIHAHGLPDGFPERVLAETEDLPTLSRDNRTDLTGLALITIDPPDARDHDDAVHAEPDTSANNKGGHIVTVAIADVTYYVAIGSHLDHEALRRANSVYFPDRVVAMLPEKISTDLCSLRENVERPCLAVQMVFNARGEKIRHKFIRGIMRSAAKLSYAQAQSAIDGTPCAKTDALVEPVLKPLWNAYSVVAGARDRRGPLELNIPERKIKLDDKGRVADVVIPERLTAHRLIEEFMIQANVAAAETLESKYTRLIYRAHDKPSKGKLKSLRDFLETLDLKVPAADKLKPSAFNAILKRAEEMPTRDLINEVILRSQAQAVYSPDNCGHFGLNLTRYTHFTSPIRRYSDLIVHRLLISALKFGDDGYNKDNMPKLSDVAESISQAERRAMIAERETVDRLIAAHLADRVGATFKARISGVTRSGLFVRLEETGADGFVPITTLGNDYFEHIEEAFALLGQRSNLAYRLGDVVEVRLEEAVPTAGALRFEMLSPGTKGQVAPIKGIGKGGRPRFRHRPRTTARTSRRGGKRRK
ncbi:MAG: ribonuclease R [Hyphomicrobiaceae bacterium]